MINCYNYNYIITISDTKTKIMAFEFDMEFEEKRTHLALIGITLIFNNQIFYT